ncbi:MAG: LapA family protein [Bacteroidales bacterium]
MGTLFLATLGMMAFTFVIGFVVAGVIKLTAYGADSMEYYDSNRKELKRLKKMRKARFKRLRNLLEQMEDEDPKYNEEYYHGVSKGASKFDLCNYYYPEEERIFIIESEKDYNAPDYKISRDSEYENSKKKKED